VDAFDEYAILQLDPDGCIRSWNGNSTLLDGYSKATLQSQHISVLYPDSARAAGVPEWNLDTAAEAVIQVRSVDDGGHVRERRFTPLLGTSAPQLWRSGDRVDDVVWIDGLEPGTYSIQVGLRVPETGAFLDPGLIDAGSVTVAK
jgi:hypothetical protein